MISALLSLGSRFFFVRMSADTDPVVKSCHWLMDTLLRSNLSFAAGNYKFAKGDTQNGIIGRENDYLFYFAKKTDTEEKMSFIVFSGELNRSGHKHYPFSEEISLVLILVLLLLSGTTEMVTR